MFWKKNDKNEVNGTLAERVALDAEGLYRSGKMHCAEAAVTALRNAFLPEMTEEVSHLAAGFGGGSGSGCLCGAVVGATIGFGLIRRDRKEAARLTKDLHHWFKEEYRSTCCRLIRAEDKGICPELTGKVAGKAAELLG